MWTIVNVEAIVLDMNKGKLIQVINMITEVLQDTAVAILLLCLLGKHNFSLSAIDSADVMLTTIVVVMYHAWFKHLGYNKLQYCVHCFIIVWMPSSLSLLDWQVAWQVWPVPSAMLLAVDAGLWTISIYYQDFLSKCRQ